MSAAPIPKSPHSERMTEAHRRIEHDLVREAANRVNRWPLPEDHPAIVRRPTQSKFSKAEGDARLRVHGEQNLMRKREIEKLREEFSELRERVERLEKRA